MTAITAYCTHRKECSAQHVIRFWYLIKVEMIWGLRLGTNIYGIWNEPIPFAKLLLFSNARTSQISSSFTFLRMHVIYVEICEMTSVNLLKHKLYSYVYLFIIDLKSTKPQDQSFTKRQVPTNNAKLKNSGQIELRKYSTKLINQFAPCFSVSKLTEPSCRFSCAYLPGIIIYRHPEVERLWEPLLHFKGHHSNCSYYVWNCHWDRRSFCRDKVDPRRLSPIKIKLDSGCHDAAFVSHSFSISTLQLCTWGKMAKKHYLCCIALHTNYNNFTKLSLKYTTAEELFRVNRAGGMCS